MEQRRQCQGLSRTGSEELERAGILSLGGQSQIGAARNKGGRPQPSRHLQMEGGPPSTALPEPRGLSLLFSLLSPSRARTVGT